MNNYTYIVASLPRITSQTLKNGSDVIAMLDWIMSQLNGKDAGYAAFLLKGFEMENLDESFYADALKSGNRFIREYFTTDLNMRNAKVEYLNQAFKRPVSQDSIKFGSDQEPDEMRQIRKIFTVSDLLRREKEIDKYLWHKADELVLFEYFSLDKILSIMVKLCLIRRWRLLDEETGRQMLRNLVGRARGRYKDIEHTLANTI